MSVLRLLAILLLSGAGLGAVRDFMSPSVTPLDISAPAPSFVAPTPIDIAVQVRREFIAGLTASYEHGLRDHYLPAMRAAERNGADWFRAYEIASLINDACRARAAFHPSALADMRSEPAGFDEFAAPTDWESQAVVMARTAASCIRDLRAEGGAR